jgi:chaperone modulatory protein CbpM
VSYALVRPARLDLDAFARLTGTHPDLIRRLVGLALNYAAVGLVTDLLERIAVLETALRRSRRPGG